MEDGDLNTAIQYIFDRSTGNRLVESVQHLASFCRPRVLDVTTYERVGWKDPCHSHPFVPGVGPMRVNLEVCVLQLICI